MQTQSDKWDIKDGVYLLPDERFSPSFLRAMELAKTLQRDTETKHYVFRGHLNVVPPGYSPPNGEYWVVTPRMPMMGGEWYDADGIRHG
jgi:hypothetical protein